MMQWGFSGVNWCASRRIGLAIIPLLMTALVLFALLGDSFGLPINTTIGFAVAATSAVGLAVQAVHLALVELTMRR